MPDREIVKIELMPSVKMEIARQIEKRMTELGFGSDTSKLELGFPLPSNWPSDMNDQPTLAEFVVIAQKLKMKIIIGCIDLLSLKDAG